MKPKPVKTNRARCPMCEGTGEVDVCAKCGKMVTVIHDRKPICTVCSF